MSIVPGLVRLGFVALGLAASATAVEAQQSSTVPRGVPRVAGGLGILGAVPVGEFATQVGEIGGGMGHLDARLGRGLFLLGGEMGYLVYGDSSRTVPLRGLVPELPDASLKVTTTNAMFQMHARLRVQPSRGRWRPYVVGLYGFTRIFTTTGIGDPCQGEDCVSADSQSDTHISDVVLSYGAAGGITWALPWRNWGRLDTHVRYVRSGRARYLTEGAIRVDGSQATFDLSESRTDTVALYIGMAWPQ